MTGIDVTVLNKSGKGVDNFAARSFSVDKDLDPIFTSGGAMVGMENHGTWLKFHEVEPAYMFDAFYEGGKPMVRSLRVEIPREETVFIESAGLEKAEPGFLSLWVDAIQHADQ